MNQNHAEYCDAMEHGPDLGPSTKPCNCHVGAIETLQLQVAMAGEVERQAAILAGKLIMQESSYGDARFTGDVKFIAAKLDELHNAYHSLQKTISEIHTQWIREAQQLLSELHPQLVSPPGKRGYTIMESEGHPSSITCLKCGMTSFNANDVLQLYCGFCHEFHRTG